MNYPARWLTMPYYIQWYPGYRGNIGSDVIWLSRLPRGSLWPLILKCVGLSALSTVKVWSRAFLVFVVSFTVLNSVEWMNAWLLFRAVFAPFASSNEECEPTKCLGGWVGRGNGACLSLNLFLWVSLRPLHPSLLLLAVNGKHSTYDEKLHNTYPWPTSQPPPQQPLLVPCTFMLQIHLTLDRGSLAHQ